MLARFDFLAFLGVAVGAHLALWPQSDASGPAGGGAQGDTSITLAASAGALEQMVAEWEAEPQQADPPEALSAPVIDTSLPALSRDSVVVMNAPAPPPTIAGETPSQPRYEAPAAAPVSVAANALPALIAPVAEPRPNTPDVTAPDRAAGIAALVAPSAPVLPAIDTAPQFDASEFAPARSLRPAQRPADLRPPPRQQPRQQPSQQPRATQTPAPAPSAPARPAQTATGTGGGENAGQNQPRQPAAPAVNTGALMAEWGGGVRSAIERRKRYPRGTRASGTVRVRLTLTTSGQLAAVGIAGSSGSAELDQAAIAAVRNARYPRAPRGLGGGQHSFTVPLTFSP